MPFLLSFFALACFSGAYVSFQYFDAKYFELLILCGVILEVGATVAASIAKAVAASVTKPPLFDSQAVETLHELKEINQRLIRVQLAIEALEHQTSLNREN